MRVRLTPNLFRLLKLEVAKKIRGHIINDDALSEKEKKELALLSEQALWLEYHPLDKRGEKTLLLYYLEKKKLIEPNSQIDPQYLAKRKSPEKDAFGREYISLGKKPHDTIYFEFCGFAGKRDFLNAKGSAQIILMQKTLEENPDTKAQGTPESNIFKYYDKQFFLYFFYANRNTKRANLGRVVIRIDKEGKVSLRNVPDSNSPDYTGRFELINNQVLYFDLTSEDKAGARMHMKVLTNGKPTQFALGGYISYETGTIVTGSVIMEEVDSSAAICPLLLSYEQNPKEFLEVLAVVKRYLSEKGLNYARTPSNIWCEEDFKNFFAAHTSTRDMMFFEEVKPRLFISSPGQGVNSSNQKAREIHIQTLIDQLETAFGDRLEIVSQRDTEDISKTSQTIEDIQKSTFFVLVYPEKGEISFASTELGVALTCSKHILILSDQNALPAKATRLSNVTCYEQSTFDWEKAFIDIKHFILETKVLKRVD